MFQSVRQITRLYSGRRAARSHFSDLGATDRGTELALPRSPRRASDDAVEGEPYPEQHDQHRPAPPRGRGRQARERSLAGPHEPLALPRDDRALAAVAAQLGAPARSSRAARPSTKSSTRASSTTPSRRSISWTPVGLVTLISVTRP